MMLIIHDLNEEEYGKLQIHNDEITAVNAKGDYAPCQGCFKCWTKNPGFCVLKDKLQHIGALLGACEEIIIISKNFYGCYSPSIKNIMDRSISTSLPFFTYRNREVHHICRYSKRKLLKVYLYGDCTELEKQTAEEYVNANAVNMGVKNSELEILSSLAQLQEVIG